MERKRLWAPLRARNVRLLIGGTGLSQIGDWLYNVALIVFVFDRTGSAAWVAAAGVVRLVPYVLFGTIGGMIADRRPRRGTMIASDVIRAMVMFVMTVVVAREGSPALAVVLAGVATTFSVAYGPCVNAAIPRLVDEDDLSVVNTLSATVTNLSYALGPALGGVLLILGSPSAALAVNGFTFLMSAVFTAMIRGDLGPDAEHVADVPIAEAVAIPSPRLIDGLHALMSSPFVVALVVTQVMTNVLYGMETVLYALASTTLFGMGVDGVAFLYAAIGVGGIAAAGIAQRLSGRSEAGVILAVSAVLCGLPMATLAFIRVPSVAIAVLLVEGAAMIVVDVMAVTSLQRLLGADVLGRAFGTLDSLTVAGILVGIVLAPVLVAKVGLDAALLTGGALMLVAGAGVLAQARAIDRSIEAYAGPASGSRLVAAPTRDLPRRHALDPRARGRGPPRGARGRGGFGDPARRSARRPLRRDRGRSRGRRRDNRRRPHRRRARSRRLLRGDRAPPTDTADRNGPNGRAEPPVSDPRAGVPRHRFAGGGPIAGADASGAVAARSAPRRDTPGADLRGIDRATGRC